MKLLAATALLACLLSPAGAFPRPAPAPVERPAPTNKVLPAYPAVAAARGVSGAVLVDVRVNPEGRVAEASVVSGHGFLREAAKSAALRWRFNASEGGGSRSVRLTFIFHETSYAPPAGEPEYQCAYQAEVRWLGAAQHGRGMNRTGNRRGSRLRR
jgi:TonB family protein